MAVSVDVVAHRKVNIWENSKSCRLDSFGLTDRKHKQYTGTGEHFVLQIIFDDRDS